MACINPNMKTCGHILFEMVGSYFGPECIYLRYMDLNLNNNKTVLLLTCVRVVIDYGLDIDILGNERRNILSMEFLVLLITFIDHAIRIH